MVKGYFAMWFFLLFCRGIVNVCWFHKKFQIPTVQRCKYLKYRRVLLTFTLFSAFNNV